MRDHIESLRIANIIWAQLGAGMFRAMTGAKSLLAIGTKEGPGLMFALPARFASDGINRVEIILTPENTYDLFFLRVWGKKVRTVREMRGIYCDNLQSAFTQATGLDCSLGSITNGKTLSGWNASRLPLTKGRYDAAGYLEVGDRVDDTLADWWLDVLPPACWTRNIRQIGEPASSDEQGRNLYATIELVAGAWFFRGDCPRGSVQPGTPAIY